MSIWSDQAVKELQEAVKLAQTAMQKLQEKIAWLEKEVDQVKRENADLKASGPAKPLGLPHGKGKPS